MVEKANDDGNGTQVEEDAKKPEPAAGSDAPKTEAAKDTKRQQFVFVAQEKNGTKGYSVDPNGRWMCNDLVSVSVNDAGAKLRNGNTDYIRGDPHLKSLLSSWDDAKTGDVGFVVNNKPDANGRESTHIFFVDKRPGQSEIYTTFGYPPYKNADGTTNPGKLGMPSGTSERKHFVRSEQHIEVRRYDWP
jgi:hypothetical protein